MRPAVQQNWARVQQNPAPAPAPISKPAAVNPAFQAAIANPNLVLPANNLTDEEAIQVIRARGRGIR